MKRTFGMSVAAAGLAILGGCVDPAPSPQPQSLGESSAATAAADPFCANPSPPFRGVTITYAYQGTQCANMGAKPNRVTVCQGDTIKWDFVNKCREAIEAYIRVSTNPDTALLVNQPGMARPEPHPVPAASGTGVPGQAVLVADVHSSAQPTIYKYDIGGTYPLDPEIDVRRGGGSIAPATDTTVDETRSPRPTASPSGR